LEDKNIVALYETLFVVHPERATRMKEFIDRFKKVVEAQEGVVSQIDEWGLRDLAYRIEKQAKGIYTLMQYRSSARAVEELERNLKLTDGVLRYLTVRANEQTQTEPAAKSHLEEHKASTEEGTAKSEPGL
jgi:small subunit ribosomal protein S6